MFRPSSAAVTSGLHRSAPLLRGSGRPLLAALLMLSLGAAAQAQTAQTPMRTKGEGPRLSEVQRQKLFPEARALAVQNRRARIAILQQGERCIGAAGNGDAMRQCMRQERQAMQSQRQSNQTALRQAMQQLGIQVPEGPPRGKWGSQGRPPAPPSGWDHPRQPMPQL